MIVVDDPDDRRLEWFRLDERALSSRPQRRDDGGAGHFLAEGDLVVERAAQAGCRAVAVLVDATRVPPIAHGLGIDVFAAGDGVRRAVLRMGRVQPIVAVFERPPRPSVAGLAESADRIVALEAVDNPANVGAVVRNAAALGWDGLVLDHSSADPLARRALRVAMGTAFALPHARTADLPGSLRELRRGGFRVVGLTPREDATVLPATTRPGRLVAVIGSERAGLTDEAIEACDELVRIPMHAGVDSLNAAAAAAIACYALGPARSSVP